MISKVSGVEPHRARPDKTTHVGKFPEEWTDEENDDEDETGGEDTGQLRSEQS